MDDGAPFTLASCPRARMKFRFAALLFAPSRTLMRTATMRGTSRIANRQSTSANPQSTATHGYYSIEYYKVKKIMPWLEATKCPWRKASVARTCSCRSATLHLCPTTMFNLRQLSLTRRVKGGREIDPTLSVDPARRWRLSEAERGGPWKSTRRGS